MGSGYNGICYSLSPLPPALQADSLPADAAPSAKQSQIGVLTCKRFLESCDKAKRIWHGSWHLEWKKERFVNIIPFIYRQIFISHVWYAKPCSSRETMMSRSKAFLLMKFILETNISEETKRACGDALDENNKTEWPVLNCSNVSNTEY